MKVTLILSLLALIPAAGGCGKSDLEIEKEKIRQQSIELKQKIDSAQYIIDSARSELDSLSYRIKKDSIGIDSALKKLNKLK